MGAVPDLDWRRIIMQRHALFQSFVNDDAPANDATPFYELHQSSRNQRNGSKQISLAQSADARILHLKRESVRITA
jgi:hypothetical protein